jgi:SET and MYND domain-containing protein
LNSNPSLEAEFSIAKEIFDDEQSSDPNKRIKSLKKALRNDRFPAHPPYPAILHEMYLNFLDRQEPTSYIQALILLLFLFFNSDIYNYPQPQHPVRVVRLYTIAKLLQFIVSIEVEQWEVLLRKFSPGTRDALQAINFLDASYTVLILVVLGVPNSHGPGRFMEEVENELKEVHSLYRRLNRQEPKDLKAWMLDEGHADGAREAKSVGARLRNLAACYGDVVRSVDDLGSH